MTILIRVAHDRKPGAGGKVRFRASITYRPHNRYFRFAHELPE